VGKEIGGCRDERRKRVVVEKNEDVALPLAMIDDDKRPVRCSRTEGVEGRWLQEAVKAWQGLYLLNEPLAIIQKLLLPHDKTTVWIHSLQATGTSTVATVNTIVW
jgi:hypothetical protein